MWTRWKTWLARILLALLLLIMGFTCAILLFPNNKVDPICGALNATYQIEGQSVQLRDGQQLFQLSPRSPVCITTRICSAPVRGRLDGSDKNDAAVLLVQNPGNDTAYFYVGAAIFSDGGSYQGTNCLLLGRNIMPLSVSIADQVIYVTYTSSPAPGKPVEQIDARFFVKNGQLLPMSDFLIK